MMSKQQKDNKAGYSQRQENEYIKAEMRDLRYTIQEMKEKMGKMQAEINDLKVINIEQKTESQQKRDEMELIEQKVQNLKVGNGRAEAAYKVGKQKQNGEIANMQEKIHGLQADTLVLAGGFNAEKKQLREEMRQMEERFQNLKVNHSHVEAAFIVAKGKQNDEKMQMQEKIEGLNANIQEQGTVFENEKKQLLKNEIERK